MSKIAVLLALYAAVVATLLLVGVVPAGSAGGGAGTQAPAEAPGREDVRTMLAEVRALWREELKGTLQDINFRFAEMDKLRGSMEEGLQAMQQASEDAAQANYGMLETMKEDVAQIRAAAEGVGALVARLEALEKRLKAVEDRPPQIIRETILKSGPGPATPTPEGPRRPTLPDEPKEDPEVVRKETAEALEGLKSDDVDVLFPAIEKARKHRVMPAVPRLIEILAEHKEELGRMAAASALGEMKAADAVMPLAEALVDKSDLVWGQANIAIRQITGFDTELASTAGIRRRRAARNKLKEWWRSHEAEVRQRLAEAGAGG